MYGCAAKQFTATRDHSTPWITLRRAEAVHLGRVGSGAADAELGVWMITQEQILTNF